MLFTYKAINQEGIEQSGEIEAINQEIAINGLQRRGLVISDIQEKGEQKNIFEANIGSLERVTNRDIVILSRQIATLFKAQVSALRVFRLLAAESENEILARTLAGVADSLQGGASISGALAKHPKVFSDFFVNMVRAGEESGKLDEIFDFLSDHLDRTYEVTQKAQNALIYPAFIVATFVLVMILMLTMVIPKISAILLESGQDVPIYTKVVIGISTFFVDYGIFLLIAVVIGGFFLIRFIRSQAGAESFDEFKLSIPYVGNLYRKLYLSRIADNLSTMLASGISMVRALEITQAVVGNKAYEASLAEVAKAVRGGSSVSDAMYKHPEIIPGIMVQMVKIGEETGNLSEILETLSRFYRREVTNAVDSLVGLIEPVMIVVLAVGVGILLASVLIPIYNISATF